MNKIISLVIGFLFVCSTVYAAQVAVVATDTRQEAWAKETLNNSDLQTNIDGKADTLGADDNYVTDAEKVVIGNTSGTNTGDDPADDTAYGVGWNADTGAATKNAIYDKIETIAGGSMTYPGAGIPVSTGLAWDTSYSISTLGAALEADMLLQSMQGAVTDGQVPNDITITGLSGTNTGDNTVATSGDSATSFFSSGTLEDARLSTNVPLLNGTETVTGDWTFSGTTTLPANGVNDLAIDWGTGTNQVSHDDIPDGATYVRTTNDFTSTLSGNITTNNAKVSATNTTVTIATTGLVSGGTVTKSTAIAYTVGTTNSAESYGGVIYVTATCTITLPAVAAGMSVCIIADGTATVTIDPNGTEVIRRDGTAQTGGVTLVSPGVAGDIAVLTYHSSGVWYAATNTWTEGS